MPLALKYPRSQSISYIHNMKFFSYIDRLIDWVGRYVSLLNLVLVLLICLDVALRYIFSYSKNWMLELEWHLFAIIFLIGASYALQHDQHVRVDVFYQKMSKTTQAYVNIIGTLLFLFPWLYVLIKTSSGFALNSWYMGEGSPNPGGLPARYLIKAVMPLAFILLALEGLAMLRRNIQILKGT